MTWSFDGRVFLSLPLEPFICIYTNTCLASIPWLFLHHHKYFAKLIYPCLAAVVCGLWNFRQNLLKTAPVIFLICVKNVNFTGVGVWPYNWFILLTPHINRLLLLLKLIFSVILAEHNCTRSTCLMVQQLNGFI